MANISMMTFIWVFCILCLVNVGLCAGTTVPTTSTKTPVTQSTGTTVHTASTKKPVTQSTGTIVPTTSTKTPVKESTGTTVHTASTKTPVTQSTGTIVPTTITKTPVTQSTGTTVPTTSTKTPVTQSTGTIVPTTSTKTPVTQSTGTTVHTASTKTPVTQSIGTTVHTASTKTPVTQSTGTTVPTTSTKTPVTQSTGNDGSTTETKNPETTSHGTGVTSDHGKDNVTPTEKGLSEACQPGECQSPLRCYFGKCACGTNLYYANSRCHHMPAVVNVTTTLAFPSKDIRDTDITEDFLSSLDKELYDRLKRSIPGLKKVLLLDVSIENSTTGILHITTKNVINTTVSRNTQNNGENGTAHSGTQKPENYLVNLADGLKNLTEIQLKVQNYTFERPSVEVEGKCFDPNNITNEVLTRWGQQIRVQVYHNAITPISTISPDNSTSTSTSTSTVSDGSSSAMDAATIGAAVGGGVAGLIVIVVVAILVHQHYSKKRSNKVDVLPRNDETACEGNSESQVEYHMKDISQTA